MADVEISIIVRMTSERGIALFQGETREVVNETTGEIVDTEHWHWVAKRFVKRLDGQAQRGRPERVLLPEWLAKKEGLI